MKHRLISLVATLVFLVSLGIGLVQPTIVYAVTPGETAAANSYCNSHYNQPTASPTGQSPSSTQSPQAVVAECVKGFLAALGSNASNPPSSNPDDRRGVCYTSLYKGNDLAAVICQTAYIYAHANKSSIDQTTTAPSERQPNSEAITQCINSVWNGDATAAKAANGGALLNDCVTGYVGGKNGQSKADACKSVAAATVSQNADQVYCQKGYDAATNNQNQNASDSCESSGGGFSLNWALCDAYQGIQAVTNYVLNSIISPLLSSTPICLPNNPNCHDTIYQIWSNFRIYGDIFLVITLLVIVFGESIGGGMIEAYTAKKVLPRLLAAAILLNLSIYIMAFAIDMTNIIGGGIGQLITSPIPGNGSLFTIKPSGITADAIFGTAAGAGLLAGAFAINVAGIALLLLGLAITGALAILAVFVTLIIRQSIIIGLVLISPIAFALWCLPNTEKWFKRWWETFFQMLLVYPMVVVLFAVADVMSYLTENNGNGGSYVNNIIAFLLLLIPLYLVPFTLRSSNRLMGAIQGATSGIARQINGVTGRRALAGAGQQSSEKLRRTGNFEAMGNRNALFRGISTVGGAVANPRSLLRGRAGVRSARQAKQITHGAEALKDNAIFQANQGDDKFLLAVANRGLAEQKLAKTQQKFEEARSRGDMAGMTSAQSTMDAQQHALDAAAQLGATGRSTGVQHQALQALSRTGFQFDAGAEGYAELSDTARQLSRGDERAYSAIMNESQFNLRSASRFDLGGINDGAGYNPGAGVSKASLYELANAKAESIQGLMDSVDTSATRPTQQHAVVYKELQAMLPNSKGAVRDEIVRQVDNLEQFGVKDFLQQPTGVTRTVTDPRTRQEVKVPETNDDVAQREARTYERPDPNRLGGDTPPDPNAP